MSPATAPDQTPGPLACLENVRCTGGALAVAAAVTLMAPAAPQQRREDEDALAHRGPPEID